MVLPHREAMPAQPAGVEPAELRVAIAGGGMLLEILLVQQLQRDARLAELGVQVGAVRHGAIPGGQRRASVKASV